MELEFQSRSERDRCLSIYGPKFFGLVREAKAKKYFATDYNALGAIRKLLVHHDGLESLVPSLEGRLDGAGMIKLVEVAPLFNASPVDLKAYILMSLGMRAYPTTAAQ
jgi:hypothetical protein